MPARDNKGLQADTGPRLPPLPTQAAAEGGWQESPVEPKVIRQRSASTES